MTRRELAAFNFIDLSGEASTEGEYGSSYSAATTSLDDPRRSWPDNVDTLRRRRSVEPDLRPPAAQINNRDFRHPSGSTSLVENRVNVVDSLCFHRPSVDVDRRGYDPSDSLRQQSSSSRQGLLRHHLEEPTQVAKRPVTQEREIMKNDPANLLGNHLTLACEASHQAGAEIDHRVNQAARKDAQKRQFMLSLQEASQQQAIIQKRPAMNILAKLQATHEQASKRTSQFNSDNSARVPPGTSWMKPTSVPSLENHGAANMVDMMKACSAVSGSLNWAYQQQQCLSDIQAAKSILPREPSGSGCKHPRRARMTIVYASMVNVYDDVPFDLAQAVCMMLMGYRSKWPPPGSHESTAPVTVPPSPPESSAPSPPSPSPPQAPSTSKAGPSHSVQETGVSVLVSSADRQPTPTPTPAGELPQARKVSLARFLDRRKDRVRSKERDVCGKMDGSPSHDKSPSRPSPEKLLPTSRSLSPAAPITSVGHNLACRSTQSPSFSGALWHQPGVASSASKATSPITPPPPKLPRQYSTESLEKDSQARTTSKRTSDHETHEEQYSLILKKARSGSEFQNHSSS